VARMLQCIAGRDGLDPRQVDVPEPEPYADMLSEDIEGVRIGVLREGFGQEGAEPDVDEAVREAVEVLRKKGAKVAEISVPEHLTLGGKVLAALMFCGSWLTSLTCGSLLVQGYHHTQFVAAFGKFLQSRADLLPPRMKFTRLLGALLGPEAFVLHGRAHNLARTLRRAYDAAFAEVDCLVMPTVPLKAPRYQPPRDEREALSRAIARRHGVPVTRNVAPFNASGHPALSVPCGLRSGLPVGMMLVGPYFADGLLLKIAYAYQQSVDWDRYFIVPV
ncbi:MAG TPA: amidase family protein, partial [Bacillota bacterium]